VPQTVNRGLGLGPNGISECNQAADMLGISDGHDRMPGPRQLGGPRIYFWGLLASFLQVAMRTEPKLPAIQSRSRSLAFEDLKLFDAADR
jgi:hypothetical protein